MPDVKADHRLIRPVRPAALAQRAPETWKRAYLDPIQRWLPIADATWEEWPDRPNCGHFYGGSYWYAIETAYPALTYAVAWRACRDLGCDAPIPTDRMLGHAVAAIRYLAFTHDSGPEDCVRARGPNEQCSGCKWGGKGETFFRASQTGSAVACMGLGAWLLWDEMDDETKQLVINVCEWYADRWCEEEPRVGTYCDTQTEENGWTAGALSFAACFLQHHPRAPAWRTAADKWIANITVTPYDVLRNRSDMDGKPVSAWTRGATSHPDFTTENHGFVHPGYLGSAIGFAGMCALNRRLAGLEMPDVIRFNREPIYDTMKKLAEADGAMLPVQGMDWWYFSHAALLPITAVSPHAVMNLLFDDPHAAHLERRCSERVRQVMDSLGNGHVCTPDPQRYRINQWQSFRTHERSAMASFAATFLLHWLLGDGAAPCTQAEFGEWQRGVHVFPHGGFVIRKGKTATAGFSWRNRPTVVVQPRDGSWAITSPATSLTGAIKTKRGNSGAVKTLGRRIDTNGGGFAGSARFERNEGALLQRVALIVPSDRIAFYFEHTTAQREISVLKERSGEVGVRNEDYEKLGALAPGRRIIRTDEGAVEAISRFGGEDEWFFAPSARWVNVDQRIGYVVFGGKGIAYQARHDYHTYAGMEDYLILSYAGRAQRYAAGDRVSRLAVTVCPNQRSVTTAQHAAATCRPRAPSLADALVTDAWLGAVNFLDKPRTLRLRRPIGEGQALAVFEGKLTVRDSTATHEVHLEAEQARALPARAHVSAEGDIEIFAMPTGEMFVSSPLGSATVRVRKGGAEHTRHLAQGAVWQVGSS